MTYYDLNKVDADLVQEALEILEAVRDSGVTLPPNWRWPLLDELHAVPAAIRRAVGA